ncbi:MAG: Flp pilus assembly protein CpaB [Acidimicrobiia bacterium]
MKRRLFGIIGALVLALVGTLVLVSYVNGAEDRALEGEKTVKVLVAAEPIAAGTPAAELEGKVTFERVPQKVKAEGAVTSINQLGKRVTDTDLMPREQIIDDRFVSPSEAETTASQGGNGMLETTISLEPQRAVGGRIQTGDTVAVVSSFDPFETPEGSTPSQTHILAHKVRVTRVQVDADGAAETDSEDDEDGNEAQPAPEGQLLVSLELSAADVERVVFTAEFGHVWLAAEPENADESGTKIVVLDNVFA